MESKNWKGKRALEKDLKGRGIILEVEAVLNRPERKKRCCGRT